MRRILVVFSLAAFTVTLAAQAPAGSVVKPKLAAPKAQSAAPQGPQVVKDLPVRKVVLYKNGVGYFEHAGSVTSRSRIKSRKASERLV